MDHERYDAWSDRARQMIAVAYGPNADQTREFYKARWTISTLLSEDPSSHLTQVAANLRRELRALEKFERQGEPDIPQDLQAAMRAEIEAAPPTAAPRPAAPAPEPPARPQPSTRMTVPLPSQPKVAAALRSWPKAPSAPAPAPKETVSKPTRVLVLGGLDDDASAQAVKAVESCGLAAVGVAEEYREALTQLGSSDASAEIAAGLVFMDADPKSRASKPSPKPECSVDLGVLMGALGPERVIAIIANSVSLPRIPKEVTRLAQDDLGKLADEIRRRIGG